MAVLNKLKKSEASRKGSGDVCDVKTISSFVLLATFLCVNLLAFAVRPDMAAMMMVPNIFLLYQMELVQKVSLWLGVLVAGAVLLYTSLDTFYIMVIHGLFYLTVVLMYVEEP